MATALNNANLSKDYDTQVSALIIDKNGKTVSTGYNGGVRECSDRAIPYSRKSHTCRLHPNSVEIITQLFPGETDLLSDIEVIDGTAMLPFEANKYPFMIHAEANAILFTDNMNRLDGATIYCTHFPCPNCALMIAQVGIERVVCPIGCATSTTKETIKESLYTFQLAGIEVSLI